METEIVIRLSPSDFPSSIGVRSATHQDVFGEFSPLSLSTSYAIDFLNFESPLTWESINALQDDDRSIGLAMGFLAHIHETRHFHDYFSTPAGICLFMQQIQKLREFYDVGEQLERRNIRWKLPLKDWVKRADCPSIVKEFYRKQRHLNDRRRIFVGRGPVAQTAALDTRSWLEVVVADVDSKVALTPRNLEQHLITDDKVVDKQNITFWHPLGLEALIEGNAQALQRSFLEGLDNKSLAAGMRERMTSMIMLDTHEGDADRLAMPYDLTDTVLTRHFDCAFDRNLICALADNALMQAMLFEQPHPQRPKEISIFESQPSIRFIEQLKAMKRVPPPNAEWPDAGFTTEAEACLAQFEMFAGEFPEIMHDKKIHPTHYIERFVAHEIITPLLKHRKAHGNSTFRSIGDYHVTWGTLPAVPVTVAGGDKLRVARYLEPYQELFLRNWACYLMWASIADQVLDDRAVIFCPRANKQYPAINRVQYRNPENCDEPVEQLLCHSWVLGDWEYLPKCEFKHKIYGMGFERP